MTPEELRYVAEDLEYLRTWGADISEPDIRRGSAVLRRLIVESVYSNAWRAAGLHKEPRLIAVDLNNIVAAGDLDKVVFVLAAGAEFRGLYVATAMMNEGAVAPEPPNPALLRENGFPGERLYGISEYTKSHSAYAFGKWISRSDVIKYIANVKGGVHLTPSQRKREAELIARVDKIERRINAMGTDGLLLEIVAIAQAIGRSEDANKFIARIGA
ncbi:MAG TPA: hypothetical protein PLY04_18340 [bacterium]|mgnify:FL=1|nr:hypothetical protein [bacterium]